MLATQLLLVNAELGPYSTIENAQQNIGRVRDAMSGHHSSGNRLVTSSHLKYFILRLLP